MKVTIQQPGLLFASTRGTGVCHEHQDESWVDVGVEVFVLPPPLPFHLSFTVNRSYGISS